MTSISSYESVELIEPNKEESKKFVDKLKDKIKNKNFRFKIKKRYLALTALVLMLSGAVYINYLYTTGELEPLVEAGKNYGDSILVSKSSDEEIKDTASYFSEARVTRKQTREEAVATIHNLFTSDDNDSQSVALVEKAEEITANMELETKIESMIKAKGFEDCVVYISGEYADVMVQTEGLLDTDAAVIKDAIIKETSVPVENISIVEVKG